MDQKVHVHPVAHAQLLLGNFTGTDSALLEFKSNQEAVEVCGKS
jgi:hypothetical protein